jgi:hypothetical protein
MTMRTTEHQTPDLSLPLDCGHLTTRTDFRPGYSGGSGYATTPEGKRICYPCADDREREHLRTDDRIVGYLQVYDRTIVSYNGGIYRYNPGGSKVTTWPGGDLMRVTSLKRTRHNIGGFIFRLTAIDVHGQHWYGTSPGPGMYCRMRKAVQRPRWETGDGRTWRSEATAGRHASRVHRRTGNIIDIRKGIAS